MARTNQVKPFRNWLQETWYDHLDELMTLGLPPPKYALQQYFNTYKYWLKREYKHYRNQHDLL